MRFFDVRQLKALINVLLLTGDNIKSEDAKKLCRAIADDDFETIAELVSKHLTAGAD